jgi:hypothetical protein
MANQLKVISFKLAAFLWVVALGTPARAWDHFNCQLSITAVKDSSSPSREVGEYLFVKRLPQPKKGEAFDDIYLFMGQRDDLVARLKLAADQTKIVGSIFYSEHGGLGLANIERVGPEQALATSRRVTEVHHSKGFDPSLSLGQQNSEQFGPHIQFHRHVGNQYLRTDCLVCSSKNPHCSRVIDEKTNRERRGKDGSPFFRVLEIVEFDEKNPSAGGGRK